MRERLTRSHIVGAALVLLGIGLIAANGLAGGASGSGAWIGDILFVVSSLLCAGFTVLVRYWRLDAMKVTAVVAVLSLCLILPTYLCYRGLGHVASLPLQPMLLQGLVQGLVQAVITIAAYSHSIAVLGVSRAVLFPASVPAVTVLIGTVALDEVPGATRVAGLAVVSVGLFVAVGAIWPVLARTTASRTSERLY